MKKLSYVLALGTSIVGLSSAAMAADIVRPPLPPGPPVVAPVIVPPVPFNWSGLYVGVNAGWATGNADSDTDFHTDLSGGFAGGQIGVNFQHANLLFGIEADAQFADIHGSSELFPGADITHRINSFGTVRGRIGLPIGTVLPYLTGGFAWATSERTSPIDGSDTATHTGTVWGAGVEWAFSPVLSAKFEFQHLDLNAQTFDITSEPSVDLDADTFRVGLNFRFH